METRNVNETFFRNLLISDHPAIEADKAIEQRLSYAFMLKSPARKICSNSFAVLFSGLFSSRHLGLKTAFGSAIVLCFLFMGNLSNHYGSNQLADSCKVQSVVVDTNYLAKDTCK